MVDFQRLFFSIKSLSEDNGTEHRNYYLTTKFLTLKLKIICLLPFEVVALRNT